MEILTLFVLWVIIWLAYLKLVDEGYSWVGAALVGLYVGFLIGMIGILS